MSSGQTSEGTRGIHLTEKLGPCTSSLDGVFGCGLLGSYLVARHCDLKGREREVCGWRRMRVKDVGEK